MKKLTYLLGLIAVLTVCSHDDDPNKTTEGYIVGYQPCFGVVIDEETGRAYAKGYYIITSKDTFVTYNVTKEQFDFSEECLQQWCKTKIRFTYKIASGEEIYDFSCNTMVYIMYPYAKQIIVQSVSIVNNQ